MKGRKVRLNLIVDGEKFYGSCHDMASVYVHGLNRGAELLKDKKGISWEVEIK